MVPTPVMGGRMARAGQSEHATFDHVVEVPPYPSVGLGPPAEGAGCGGVAPACLRLPLVGAGSSSWAAWPDRLQPRRSFAQAWASLSA